MVNNPPANARERVPFLGQEICWRRKWQPTPVYLPEKSHGERSLAGYSPWDHKRVGHNLVTEHDSYKHEESRS